MRKYSQIGGQEGRPGYRTPAYFIYKKIRAVLSLKPLKGKVMMRFRSRRKRGWE